jgi:hypothetical protein
VPQAPSITSVTGGNAQVSVAFSANATGGSAITGYTVTSSPGGLTATGSSSPLVVTGLTNGTSYTFTATATNTHGTSLASSASSSVTPVSTSYYLVSFGTSGAQAATSIAKDSSGNWYTAGVEGGSEVSGIRKFNSELTSITWQKKANLGQYTGYDGLELDSSGNPILGGYNNQNGRVAGRAKFSASDGSTTWHYYYGVGGYGNGLAQDAAGNLYSAHSGSSSNPGVLKTDSNGTNQVYYNIGNGTYGTGVAYNPSNDLIFYLSTGSASVYRGELTCINTSGTVQWSKYFTNTYSTIERNAISFDSSNNIYVAAWAADNATNGGYALAVKFDSSGNLQWSRKLDVGTGSQDQYSASVVDSSGNIYFVGATGSSGLIVKYNSSGTIQWQRTMTNCSFNDVRVESNAELIVSGTLSTASGEGLIIRVPTDGTKTGTYTLDGVSLNYSASSLTESASGLSAANTGYGSSASTPSRTSVGTSYSNDTSTITKVTI